MSFGFPIIERTVMNIANIIIRFLATIVFFVVLISCGAAEEQNKMKVYSNEVGTFYTDSGSIGRSCSHILKTGAIYDKFGYLSSRNRVTQYVDWACNSKFQSADEMQASSVELGIPIDNLPAPLKFNFSNDSSSFKASTEKWCKSVYANLSDDSLRQVFSETINQGMISAAGKCIEAEKEIALKKIGAYVSAEPLDQYLSSFGVTLSMRSPIVGVNKIINIEPGEVRCTIGGVDIRPTPTNPYVVAETNEVLLTCYKDGATPKQLAIATYPAGASPWVSLPGTRDDSEIVEIKQNQAAIIQMFRSLEERRKEKWASLLKNSNVTSVVGGGRDSGLVNCPDGHYVAGIQVIDTDGGSYCGDCVSQFRAICRQLNVIPD